MMGVFLQFSRDQLNETLNQLGKSLSSSSVYTDPNEATGLQDAQLSHRYLSSSSFHKVVDGPIDDVAKFGNVHSS